MNEAIRYDVVVVGAGPAGLAASLAAANRGAKVALIDEGQVPGGQIWRAHRGRPSSGAISRVRALSEAGVNLWSGCTVFDAPGSGTLGVAREGQGFALTYSRLVLACGAREVFLPFPGWRTPGVVGVGGLQALVKGGLSVENKEVIVCGSGPLLVAVASYLRRAGASVPMLLECVPAANLRSLAIPLLTRPTLLRQAMSLRWSLRGVRIALGAQVLGVEGSQEGKSLRWSDARGRGFQTRFDWLACGFGLVPNLELAGLLGCEMAGQAVGVDDSLETSVRGVFAAGELLGIGGVECALIEGEIAGASAAGDSGPATQLRSRRRHARAWADSLGSAYAWRTSYLSPPGDEETLCVCEGVRLGAVKACSGFREARVCHRLGMGPCQGKTCGPAATRLFGWEAEPPKAPIRPVQVGSWLGVLDPGSAPDRNEP